MFKHVVFISGRSVSIRSASFLRPLITASKMRAQKRWFGSPLFVDYVLRSGTKNDECMAAGIKAVRGYLPHSCQGT